MLTIIYIANKIVKGNILFAFNLEYRRNILTLFYITVWHALGLNVGQLFITLFF